MIQVLPILTQEQADEVSAAAKSDNEGIFQPSHMVLKDGEIVGAFSVNMSVGCWWMHKTKAKPRDSLAAFQSMEAIFADREINEYIMPCHQDSKFYNLMPRGGYEIIGRDTTVWNLFYRKIR